MLNPWRALRSTIRDLRHPFLKPEYNVTRGDASRRQIAFTFDGHPGADSVFQPAAAAFILEALKARKIGCTFFLTGHFVMAYPDLSRCIVEDGHEIGNHTFSHPHLNAIGENAFARELDRTAKALLSVTGKKMAPFWRAPYGEYHRRLWQSAAQRGYRHIGWTGGRKEEDNFDSLDWLDDPSAPRFRSSARLKECMLSSVRKSGAISLFHLGARKHDSVYKILPELLDGIIAQDYRIVTISELLSICHHRPEDARS